MNLLKTATNGKNFLTTKDIYKPLHSRNEMFIKNNFKCIITRITNQQI
jgi:hypothetical protein